MVSFKGIEDDVTWTYGFNSAICWSTASALKKQNTYIQKRKKTFTTLLFKKHIQFFKSGHFEDIRET